MLSAARLAGLVYGALGCVLSVIFLVSGTPGLLLNTAKRGDNIALISLSLVTPFLYGGAGFVFGALGAALFNAAARKTGGIEFSVEEIRQPS